MSVPQAEKLFRVTGVPFMRTQKYHGEIRDSRGVVLDSTPEYIESLAERYSPDTHEARVKLGHTSRDSDPTSGYAETIYTKPGSELQGVAPELKNATFLVADYAAVPESQLGNFKRTGPYPRRSAEIINLDDQPYVGDISHLGAARPAIKGLPAITNSQITEMSEEEVAALSEHTPIRGGSGGVMLFSEDKRKTITDEEHDMANDEAVKLAEQQAAEEKAKREAAEKELAEFKEKSAKAEAELKLSEATAANRAFAEEHKLKFAPITPEQATAILTFADSQCPNIAWEGKEIGFGELLRNFVEQLPKLPAGRFINLGAPKPKPSDEHSREFADDDWSSDAVHARVLDLREEKPELSYSEAYEIIKKSAIAQGVKV